MWFDIVFVTLFLAGWLTLAAVPWVALSVRTKGEAGMVNLLLCLLTGVVGALAVPLLGKDDALGIWLSFAVALVAPAVLLAIRRYSLGAHPAHAPAGKAAPRE